MRITKATAADAAALQPFDRHISDERLHAALQEGFVYLLWEDECPIGVLRYSLFWQAVPFLDLLYLDEGHRRQGYGTRAMAYWEAEMRTAGYPYLLLSTQEDEEAQFFYDRLGYTRCGGFTPPGQEAVALVCYKEL